MLRGYDIICLSTQDWDDLWTRKQRFMLRLARQGNRVLYVQQQLHLAGYLRQFRAQWRRPFISMAGSRRVEENLYIYTLPILWPGDMMSLAANRFDYVVIARSLRREMARLGMRRPILWTYVPTAARLAGVLEESLMIYECVDDFRAARGLVKREVVGQLENALEKKANLVIVTSQHLYDLKQGKVSRLALIPNGADVEHFAKAMAPETRIPEELQSVPQPRVGFLGSIHYWVDLDLVRYLAVARPEWSFVLVGPVGRLANINAVSGLKNVHFMGRQPYEKLPGYLKAFDACIVPYVPDDVAKGASPLKLYEYLASGKPVVSVDMPEAAQFEGLVRIAGGREEFLQALAAAVAENDPGLVKRRIEEAHRHSWGTRFVKEEQVIEQVMEETLHAHRH